MASVWKTALGCAPDGFEIVKACDKEYTGNVRLGDLFMVKCDSSFDGSRLGYYHAGVYCSEEDEDIIHFRLSSSQSSSSASWNSSYGEGDVNKVSVDVFHGKYPYAIYRKEGGIPASFREKVKEAMKQPEHYKLLKYNCIHFALELLDVEPKTIEDYLKKFLEILGRWLHLYRAYTEEFAGRKNDDDFCSFDPSLKKLAVL